jgi:2-amino-4-hydroxy-6-hydroxymethyldihydropteridine diphosphokinase
MHICYLSLGSNIEKREQHLADALNLLGEQGIMNMAESPVYETEPWGFSSPLHFLNQVIRGECHHSAVELFHIITEAEKVLGRVRYGGARYENRNIDIDILFYDNMVISLPHLEIPHPRIAERRFILEPLAMIAPGLVHPVLQQDIATLLAACPDRGGISIFNKTLTKE